MRLAASIPPVFECISGNKTHHVLPPLHEFLVDDFARIVLASLDMHGLLDDRVRPTAKSLASTILITPAVVRDQAVISPRSFTYLAGHGGGLRHAFVVDLDGLRQIWR